MSSETGAGAADRGASHWSVVSSHFQRLADGPAGERPNYLWSTLHAADVAVRSGIEAISVAELGVAGGTGLVALEAAAAEAQRALEVEISVFGFDTGSGLPASDDPRDAPFLMDPGDFPMDVERLRGQLRSAELVLGPVTETVPSFLAAARPPLAFCAFDLDYYTSTRDALGLFRGDPERCLPRVLCYFDDVHGYPWGEHNGARLAIAELNEEGHGRRVDRLEGLRWLLPRSQFEQRWPEATYLAHLFDHPRYGEPEGTALVSRLDLAGP